MNFSLEKLNSDTVYGGIVNLPEYALEKKKWEEKVQKSRKGKRKDRREYGAIIIYRR